MLSKKKENLYTNKNRTSLPMKRQKKRYRYTYQNGHQPIYDLKRKKQIFIKNL